MAWDSSEVERLLREVWPNPTMLAQELFAILSSNSVPMSTDAPVSINMTPGQKAPALTLNTAAPGQAALLVNSPDGTPAFSISDAGISFPPVGLGSINLDGSPSGGPVNSNPDMGNGADSPLVGTGGGGQAGTIVSGTGSAYSVKLVTGKTVAAVQLQIDPSQTIPAGTGVILAQVGSKFYMQVPVWL